MEDSPQEAAVYLKNDRMKMMMADSSMIATVMDSMRNVVRGDSSSVIECYVAGITDSMNSSTCCCILVSTGDTRMTVDSCRRSWSYWECYNLAYEYLHSGTSKNLMTWVACFRTAIVLMVEVVVAVEVVVLEMFDRMMDGLLSSLQSQFAVESKLASGNNAYLIYLMI